MGPPEGAQPYRERLIGYLGRIDWGDGQRSKTQSPPLLPVSIRLFAYLVDNHNLNWFAAAWAKVMDADSFDLQA